MPRCDCAGSTCQCLILAGAGIEVTGSGNTNNPYVVTATTTIAGSLVVQDTATVDLTAVGAGSPVDPFVLSARATVAMEDLTNVTGAPPALGDTLSWNGTAWVMAPPPVAPAGAINTGAGLLGNGSLANPVRAATSGTWGTAPLDRFGPDSTVGQVVYVDSNGQLRASPIDPAGVEVPWDQVVGKPSAFPSTWDQVAGKPTAFPTVWTQVAGRPVQYHAILSRQDIPANSGRQVTVSVPAGLFTAVAQMVVQATMADQSQNSNMLHVAATATSPTAVVVAIRNQGATAQYGRVNVSVFRAGQYA